MKKKGNKVVCSASTVQAIPDHICDSFREIPDCGDALDIKVFAEDGKYLGQGEIKGGRLIIKNFT